MTTVTVAQYRTLTGDSTTADNAVTAALGVAEGLVEEYLRRELREAIWTEQCRLWPVGLVFPRHTPVTSVPASATYTRRDDACIDNVPAAGDDIVTDQWPLPQNAYPTSLEMVTVTFTGGWSSTTVPYTIQYVVSRIANRVITPTAIPDAGVVSKTVGDVSVTYSPEMVAGAGNDAAAVDLFCQGASALLRRYRWRPL